MLRRDELSPKESSKESKQKSGSSNETPDFNVTRASQVLRRDWVSLKARVGKEGSWGWRIQRPWGEGKVV
jgi:hypothetical protein